MDDDEVQIIDVCISSGKNDKVIKKALNRRQTTIDGKEPSHKPLASKSFIRASTIPRESRGTKKRKSNSSKDLKDCFASISKKPTFETSSTKQKLADVSEDHNAKTKPSPQFVSASNLLASLPKKGHKASGSNTTKETELSSDEDFLETSFKNSVSLSKASKSPKSGSKTGGKLRRSSRLKACVSNKEEHLKRSTVGDEDIEISKQDISDMDNENFDIMLLEVESKLLKPSHSKNDQYKENRRCDVNYFDQLPLELLQRIFVCLPDDDLKNCFVVSKWWNSVIKDSRFMRWKKCYHRLSHHLEEKSCRDSNTVTMALEELFNLIEKTELIDSFLKNSDEQLAMAYVFPRLLSYFNDYCPSTAVSILPYLQHRPLWDSMKLWFAERFTDALQPNGEPFSWSFLIGCFIVARSVEETEWIFTSMMHQFSEDMYVIIDFLYGLAYILRLMSLVSQTGVWFRIHYRIIHRLRRLEKSGGVILEQLKDRLSCPGQQSILRYGSDNSKLNLTHEQLKIARHELHEGDVIRINAFAGTGKTTTLLNFSRFNPGRQFLMIVYNKAAQLHAQKIFPKNVECRTGHSLAFQAVGRNYRHKLGNLNHRNLVDILSKIDGGGNLFRRVKLVKNALEGFIASSTDTITSSLVTVESDSKEKSQATNDAKKIWEMMQDRNHICKMTHDGYLKMWQLSEPSLVGYDAILVDEAQDMNPCMLDIVIRQRQPKIFVGDPHQQIFTFRGSVNVLDIVEATHIYHLTQSFRFGEPIAFAAQCILSAMKKEEHLITGTDRKSSIHGDFNADGQVTIICRNNANVFFAAHKIAMECSNSIHIIGGLESVGVSVLLQIYYMSLPEDQRKMYESHITDDFLRRFLRPTGSLADLIRYATMADDVELANRILVVQTLRHRLPDAVAKVKLMHTGDQTRAHFQLTTAHKSKGLEFRSVLLGSDLEVDLLEGRRSEEDINLLYVATTRAQNFLAINSSLYDILGRCGEHFCQLRPSEEQTKSVFKLFQEPFLTLGRFFERREVSRIPTPLSPGSHLEGKLRSWMPLIRKDNEDENVQD